MPAKVFHIGEINGLNENEVDSLRRQFGKNIFEYGASRHLIHIIRDIIKEPMFILLCIACMIYFILGDSNAGLMMLFAMLFVAAISLYQENRSTEALKALKEYTEPKVTVIRNGVEKIIDITELVPGDIVVLEEGGKVPADALLLQANDLSINESIITGESLPAEKATEEGKNILYQGTTVNSGKCIARITATGNQTTLGRLGKSVATYNAPPTLLQQQINRFVRRLAFFGFVAFVIILVVNFFKSEMFIESLLFALTLAMAAIPEEIPVAFSSFMALGAFHMSRLGIISRQPQTIENLGAVSVICLDKTGTITENRMQLNVLYDHDTKMLKDLSQPGGTNDLNVLRYAMLASEINPFDAMEKAIHEAYQTHTGNKTPDAMEMVYEYPLQGRPPMMTHVYQGNNQKIVAAKGAIERILKICGPDQATANTINEFTKTLAAKGYRVLGVASAVHGDGEFPADQDGFKWKLEGLVSFYDPPKKDMAALFRGFYDAKIRIKLLTGDYTETAMNIAEQVGMQDYQRSCNGDEVMQMDDKVLRQTVNQVNIFSRMFPEAKLKVIDALKANGEIVAMTGDGVNDGPALQAADIGIAMGKNGTEIARQAADLVLTDDELQKVSEAILQGRKIFSNLKKAIRYIISIHIPIILTASLPLLLGWKYPNIFTPIHVIFLEIIMGPTCSIFFEREPVEENIMKAPPRDRRVGLFTKAELLVSIVQGLIITTGVLMLYYFFMIDGRTIEQTRMIVFTTLLLSNVLLTFVNRSFTENFTKTFSYRNNLVLWVLGISALFLLSLHFITPVRNIFQLAPISGRDFFICAAVSFASVFWFEGYKTNLNMVEKS